MSGKSLRIFVTGNSPRSLKKVTEFNWSGYAFYGSREQLKQIYKRSESQNSGIYFLLSEINTEMTRMYVGETENFSNRIRNHHQTKDWWTHFIVFQSESSLNKAHIRYLEYKFWKRASESMQIEVVNEQSPQESSLSEEDISDLSQFEDNILYIMEAMNLGYFSSQNLNIREYNTKDCTYEMNIPKTDYLATMIKADEKYILKAGSYIRNAPRESFEKRDSGYFKKWQDIVSSDKVKQINKEVSELLVDLEFLSCSAAGAIVAGGATNGTITWKNKHTGKTIKDELAQQDSQSDYSEIA